MKSVSMPIVDVNFSYRPEWFGMVLVWERWHGLLCLCCFDDTRTRCEQALLSCECTMGLDWKACHILFSALHFNAMHSVRDVYDNDIFSVSSIDKRSFVQNRGLDTTHSISAIDL